MRYLVKGKDPINLLPCDTLRDGNLSLVLIAGHDLWSIVPQFLLTKRPEK